MFTATLHEPYPHICLGDPALDTEHKEFDHERWCECGDDKFLPLKSGALPVTFMLRHLEGKEIAHARGIIGQIRSGSSTMSELVYELCALALAGWENVMREGEEVEFGTVRGADRFERCDPKLMLMLMQKPEFVEELGARVLLEDIAGSPLSGRASGSSPGSPAKPEAQTDEQDTTAPDA